MSNLSENFKDAVLAAGMNGKRRIKLTEVSGGVYEMEDVTEYSQQGSSYGASQVNNLNHTVNGKIDTSTIVDSADDAAAVTKAGVPVGCKAFAELANDTGTWIGSTTVGSGSTSAVIENAAITANSLIDVYYAESSKETVASAGVTYSQAAGSLTLTFGSALEAAVTISNIKVVNV